MVALHGARIDHERRPCVVAFKVYASTLPAVVQQRLFVGAGCIYGAWLGT